MIGILDVYGQMSPDSVESIESELNFALTDEDRQLIKENVQWMTDYQEPELNDTPTEEGTPLSNDNATESLDTQTTSDDGLLSENGTLIDEDKPVTNDNGTQMILKKTPAARNIDWGTYMSTVYEKLKLIIMEG